MGSSHQFGQRPAQFPDLTNEALFQTIRKITSNTYYIVQKYAKIYLAESFFFTTVMFVQISSIPSRLDFGGTLPKLMRTVHIFLFQDLNIPLIYPIRFITVMRLSTQLKNCYYCNISNEFTMRFFCNRLSQSCLALSKTMLQRARYISCSKKPSPR